MAILDLQLQRYAEARIRLQEAVEWERKALAANSANPTYRRFLTNNLTNLIVAARGLGDAAGVAEAERELAQLRDSDPAFAALDARPAGIANGEQRPANEAERLTLAQRAYDKALFATSARLWVEALDANPALADNRQTQHGYNAACCAALAATGQGRDVPQPDAAAKAKLRRQALGWLKAELAAWTSVLAVADEPQRGFVARTLEHWQGDPDLARIRDPDAVAKLPDDERAALAELWTEVASLRKQAETPRAEQDEP